MAAPNDTDADVREQTAWALGAIGDRRAESALRQAMRDPDTDVRSQVAWAQGVLGGKK